MTAIDQANAKRRQLIEEKLQRRGRQTSDQGFMLNHELFFADHKERQSRRRRDDRRSVRAAKRIHY